jgi:hypothetical protein
VHRLGPVKSLCNRPIDSFEIAYARSLTPITIGRLKGTSRVLGGRKGIYRDEQPIQILAALLEQVGRIVPREELQRLREPGRRRVCGSPVTRSPVRTCTEYPIKLGTSSGRRDGAVALPLHEAQSSRIIGSDTLIAYERPSVRRSKASNLCTPFT